MSKIQPSYSNNLWFPNLGNHPDAKYRIFCFPYAGGSSSTYNKWSKGISRDIEVCAIQLPGRANRMNEKACTRVEPLVDVLLDNILTLTDKPFALFGHSMGAIICYELGQKLVEKTGCEPVHLFVSGRPAPHIKSREKITYSLPKDEFINELYKLNGTPKEVLENAELLELVLPLLRADFELVETYQYRERPPLPCPITAFGGIDDNEVSMEELNGWKLHTLSRFELKMIEGDHFFINKHENYFTSVVAQALNCL